MAASSSNDLHVRILGCGSSGGVPRVGNDWGACDPSDPRNRRSRCSILMTRKATGGDRTVVLIDTSPDLREQLLAANVSVVHHVAITHSHADQCHGIDDLRALTLRSRARIPVHMDTFTANVLTKRFDYCFEAKAGYPAILDAKPDLAPGSSVPLEGPGGAINLECLDLDHGTMPSLGFRCGAFAYCNDVVRMSDATLERLHGLDTIILDALRYTPHPTHATVAQALGWIEQLKPRRAILTNLHIDLDYRKLSQELPHGVTPAYDGMEFTLPAT
ncbi:MBL fold metallo-hydrolase [bacterium]|nr:MBL fold metallo-hydrolase [bacterium]